MRRQGGCRLAFSYRLLHTACYSASPKRVTRPSPSHERKSLLCSVARRGDVVVRTQQTVPDPRACTSLLVGLPRLDSADLDLVCTIRPGINSILPHRIFTFSCSAPIDRFYVSLLLLLLRLRLTTIPPRSRSAPPSLLSSAGTTPTPICYGSLGRRFCRYSPSFVCSSPG